MYVSVVSHFVASDSTIKLDNRIREGIILVLSTPSWMSRHLGLFHAVVYRLIPVVTTDHDKYLRLLLFCTQSTSWFGRVLLNWWYHHSYRHTTSGFGRDFYYWRRIFTDVFYRWYKISHYGLLFPKNYPVSFDSFPILGRFFFQYSQFYYKQTDTNIQERKWRMFWFSKDQRIFKGITISIEILTTIYTGSIWIIHHIWLSLHSIFIILFRKKVICWLIHFTYIYTHSTHTHTSKTLSLLTTSYSCCSSMKSREGVVWGSY